MSSAQRSGHGDRRVRKRVGFGRPGPDSPPSYPGECEVVPSMTLGCGCIGGGKMPLTSRWSKYSEKDGTFAS